MRKGIVLCSSLEIICIAFIIIIMNNKDIISKPILDILIIAFGIIMAAVVFVLVALIIKSGHKK